MAAPRLPQQFGPYTLQELIARGGMAEIYRATIPGIGGFEKTVAIKKILPHLAENNEFITMLIDEARVVVDVNHANIAQVYDLGKIDEDYYIAMEYIHGVDLSTIAKELKETHGRTVPVEHALFIASGIAAGLHVAHNKCDDTGRPKNIVHRDVSPHNILISFAGDVKIIDFGVAKAAGKEAHTHVGVIKGKLLYMAPEQAMAKDLDGRADLFAMGLILYRMLTNRLPFEGDNEFQIYNNILSKEVVAPKQFNPDIPEEVNQIVIMLLQRDPSKRYQDGYSAKVDLDRALQNIAPGYSISRLSRWVEDEFGYVVQQRRRQFSSGNDFAPSTPSHNPVHTGEMDAWDEIDEDEDTINVAMDSPEAQDVLRRAREERARYNEMRASGELPAVPREPAPWQSGNYPMGQQPQPQQSGQWGQPQEYVDPYASQSAQYPAAGSGQYPAQSGQFQAPSGQWPQPGPFGSGQFASPLPQQPGPYGSGQFAQPGPYGSGQFPAPQQQQQPYPGQYPPQPGQFPIPQPGPMQSPSGQWPTGNAEHLERFQGPSPLRPNGAADSGESHIDTNEAAGPGGRGEKRTNLLPQILIFFLLLAIVGMLAMRLFGGEVEEVPPESATNNGDQAVPPDENAVPADPVEGTQAGADAGTDSGALADVPKVGLSVETMPVGASVFIDDKLFGSGPYVGEIPKGEKEIKIRVEADGYEPKEIGAIPFADVRRKVELFRLPESDAGTSDDEDDPNQDAAESPDKPAKKKTTRRRHRRPKPKPVEEKKDPSVPLLMDDKPSAETPDKPEGDVPVF